MALKPFGEEVYDTTVDVNNGLDTQTFNQGDDAEYDVTVSNQSDFSGTFTKTVDASSFDHHTETCAPTGTLESFGAGTIVDLYVEQNQNPYYDPSTSLTVQYSSDGGSTWNDWFDVAVDSSNQDVKWFPDSTDIRFQPTCSQYDDEDIQGNYSVWESTPPTCSVNGSDYPVSPVVVDSIAKS